ncbi:hypothetical protein [Flavobacterium cheongpyeongense]|nr:hypothetical protein [Flavobacterium cheongpyeongense]
MKKIIGLFFVISISSFAQKIRPFVGVSAYIHTDFDKSVIGDLKAGAEYRALYYLMPEIEINFMYGVLQNVTNRNDIGLVISEYSRKASVINYSFSPKIILGNKNPDGSGYIQILPKYTYSDIYAKGTTFKRNPANLSQPLEEKEKASSSQHSFGIGIGYVTALSDNGSQSLALNIYLNNVDLGKALNKLKHDKTFNTETVIGIGLNYYFSLKKKS